jgi:hypothetical protein
MQRRFDMSKTVSIDAMRENKKPLYELPPHNKLRNIWGLQLSWIKVAGL